MINILRIVWTIFLVTRVWKIACGILTIVRNARVSARRLARIINPETIEIEHEALWFKKMT